MRLYLNGVFGGPETAGVACEHGRRRGWDEVTKRVWVDCPECVPVLQRVYPTLVSTDPRDPALETVEETRRREALERERQDLLSAALKAGAEELVAKVLANAQRELEARVAAER